jgi:hypothetical protein
MHSAETNDAKSAGTLNVVPDVMKTVAFVACA